MKSKQYIIDLNKLCDGSWDFRKVGLDPCCSQDGYRAQVPQHPI